MQELLEACKTHAPRTYQYFLDLWTDLEEFNKSHTVLLWGLEQEGFDLSILLRTYLDHEDLTYLFTPWEGRPNPHSDPQNLLPDLDIADEDEEEEHSGPTMEDFFEVFIGIEMTLIRAVYAAMKATALRYMPTLDMLERELRRRFNYCLYQYALVMVDQVMPSWKRLTAYLPPKVSKEGEIDLTTLEGNRQLYLNVRKNRFKLSDEPNPIFCVEILKFEKLWETMGMNRLEVWFKLTCAEGEWHGNTVFHHLLEEALVNYPAIYAEARAIYRESSTTRPREAAILKGMQEKGHDLTMLLASYLADNVNFLPDVREQKRYLSYPGRKNMYERRMESKEKEWEKDCEGAKEYQRFNLMRDAMIDEALAAIHHQLPEFHMKASEEMLDYVEETVKFQLDELQNDANDAWEKAWEMRQGVPMV